MSKKDIVSVYTAGKKFENCFVCSQTNPAGLHLQISFEDGKARTEIIPNKNMEGMNGLMHGGFSLMLMDEIMLYAVEIIEKDVVTLNSNCDFVSRGYLGHKLIAEGWVVKQEGRKIYTEAELRDDETGEIVVRAKGLYYEVDMTEFLPE